MWRGTFEEDLQRCIFRGRRSTRDMFIRDVRRPGRWFPWEGLHLGASDLQGCWDDFAWQVQHFVWLGITFSWQAQHFRQVEWKNRKTNWHEAVSSALNFPFLKEVSPRRIVSFLMLSPSKNEEVSQNCFVFAFVNFKNWGSLAEFVSFLTLSSWKTEEVSQNSR